MERWNGWWQEMAKKYYAVAKGKKTGVFTDWPTTQKQVSGFPGARYKSFPTRQEAQAWVNAGGPVQKKPATKANIKAAPQPSTNKQYTVAFWSDGGSRNTGNVPGGHVRTTDPAAWAYLIVTESTRLQYSGSAGEFGATNNRMEIMGLLQGLRRLQALKLNREPILATLDSKYVLSAINDHWLAGWQRRGWQRANNQPLANAELWQQLAAELPAFPHIDFVWTKGHANNSGNVFVDELLNKTMDELIKKAPNQS
ncbi:ribonuclease H family protein [Schleiferilactobacillus perolens]|jgi:ribonuclease HI|uniref:ribonuclease H family protein n=1 Tax=Schleiferilactobacillus perolens TaxID=100468 RepID=UPI002357FCCE|nr:ribonuclease H family protein [Schleiferilactobacillus perolens]MCI2170336.1 ribonuclease H family protein [Schleiferilactobacillus perolens]